MDDEPSNADVAVVIPAYNEATVIADTVSTVVDLFGVVIVVDDGSRDGTAGTAKSAGARVVRHAVNLGQGGALSTGISAALMLPWVDYIVTFDADGQHRPEDAQQMVQRLRLEELDIVLGTRFGGEPVEAGALKKLLLRAALAYTRMHTGLPLTDTHNGLRAMTRAFAEGLEIRDYGMGHASDILDHVAQSGASWAEESVLIRYTDYSRAKGQSMLNSVNILFDRLMR